MIKIIDEWVIRDIEGTKKSRHADIIISNGVDHFILGVGGLPLLGTLLDALEAREPELWGVAQVENNKVTTRYVRRLSYNSQSAGGWSFDEYQEAVFEKEDGNDTMWNVLKARRTAIKTEWPDV